MILQKKIPISIKLLFSIFFFFGAKYDSQIRVSCIGNSITYGYGLISPSTQSYPAQLGYLLGPGYLVMNFGYSGATMLQNGDVPYWNQVQYANAKNSNPSIVIIKLGTNDSKPWNWTPYNSQFPQNYKTMIDTFKALPSQPKIYIAIPAKAFNSNFGISEAKLITDIRPYVIQVANENAVSVIDFYDATKDYAINFPDGIHPDTTGATIIAQKAKSILTMPAPMVTLSGNVLNVSTGYGYQWFKNGIKIANATQQNFTPTSNGTYSVLVKINSNNEDRLISNKINIDLSTLSLYNTNNSKQKIIVYLSPSGDTILIENKLQKFLKGIKIYNMSGDLVHIVNDSRDYKVSISANKFTEGVYNIIIDGEKKAKKVVLKSFK